jgi:hypothetical protein
MTQPISAAPGHSPWNDKAQSSSTDNKIKSFAKIAFEKISTFFTTCYNYCTSKLANLKARITSYFKKSAPTALAEFQQTAERLSRFSGQARKEDQKHKADQQTVRFSTPEILTPSTGALIPYKLFPFLQGRDAAMQEIYNRSLNSLVAHGFQVPSISIPSISIPLSQHEIESLLAPLHRENALQQEIPVEIAPPVNAEQVLAPYMEFAIRQNRPNTPPIADVEQFSQLSPAQKEIIPRFVAGSSPQTPQKESSSSNLPFALFGASAAVMAGVAVWKNDPGLLTRVASGAAQIAQPPLDRALDAATNAATNVAQFAAKTAKNVAEAVVNYAKDTLAAHPEIRNGEIHLG